MNHGVSRFRRQAGALLAGVLLLVPILGIGIARADDTDVNDPAFWPTSTGLNPNIETTAHSIRYAGNSRSETNFAAGLAMPGECDYPFDESADRNGDGATTLNETDCFYGADGDPQGVLITAKDRFPDSLTASALSQPGDEHTGPTAVNLVDPGNPTDTSIDMEDAPVIITDSGREGATGLSATAARLARYLNADVSPPGLNADNAIIVGGTAAVPTGVEAELATIGYDNVYRLAGIDRNDTAKAVALAQGTGDPGPFGTGSDNVCDDSDATDGTDSLFYENAAPEFWTDESTCNILPQTVVLADGGTGADALAIGWFTSFYGIPILLINADGSISTHTQSALQTLDIQNIIVAGGTGRISDPVAVQAAGFAGITSAHLHRVAGLTRSLTSIEMAMHLGGWFPQGDTTFTNDMFCVAASSGQGDLSTGWPDDLAAGPLCGAMGDNAAAPNQPNRLYPPVNGSEDDYYGDSGGSHGFVPLFLTPVGASSLESNVSDFLADAFPVAPTGGTAWCDGNQTASCDDPGFGIAFGGTAVIQDNVFKEMATLASGGRYTDFGDLTPDVTNPFFTKLDLSAVFNNSAVGPTVCANRAALKDVQFLTVYDDAALNTQDNDEEVTGDYDVDGISEPTCVGFTADGDGVSQFFGDSLSGHFSPVGVVNYRDANSLNMSAALPTGTFGSATGTASDVDNTVLSNGTSTQETHTFGVGGTTTIKGTTCTNSATGSTTTLTITRGATSAAPDTFTATFTLATDICGTYIGTATGEAVLGGGFWALRGSSTITGGTGVPAITGAVGGFTANLNTTGAGDNTDDTVTNFRLDGILSFP